MFLVRLQKVTHSSLPPFPQPFVLILLNYNILTYSYQFQVWSSGYEGLVERAAVLISAQPADQPADPPRGHVQVQLQPGPGP